jgi:hypothetical protein
MSRLPHFLDNCLTDGGELEKAVTEVTSFQRTQESWCQPPFHLQMATDPVFETLCPLEYWTMDEVEKLINPECYTLSSESFKGDS